MSDGCFAVILAAGQSSRMGEDKAALPWLDGEPLLLWMARELNKSGWQPFAVVAPERFDFWKQQLPEESVTLNPDPSRGKATSIACGVAAVPKSARWILITAVDQPRSPEVYVELWRAANVSDWKIVVPEHGGHRGHPVVVNAALRSELIAMEESDQGLRGLMTRHADRTLRVAITNYREWDLNTPEQYRQAFLEAGKTRSPFNGTTVSSPKHVEPDTSPRLRGS